MQKLTLKQFITRANKSHGNKYAYTEYKGMNIKCKIICKKHGQFYQTPSKHIRRNHGCPSCKKENLLKLFSKSTSQFIKEAMAIHGNIYNYRKTKYINCGVKIEIICKTHGSFWQSPRNHLYRKRGCAKCKGGIKYTTKQFIRLCKKVHKNKYNYSKTKYVNCLTNIVVICKSHGQFVQKPRSHITGSGCPKCNVNTSSSSQKWLDSLKIPNKYREYVIVLNKNKFIVDAYDPRTNTVYEYYGSFWHGNPKKYNKNSLHPIIKKTFGELYKKTIKRKELIISAGYKFICVWGS